MPVSTTVVERPRTVLRRAAAVLIAMLAAAMSISPSVQLAAVSRPGA
jgi:hypothetical protein